MAVQIQFRRDLAATWTSVNPILAQGEMGIELDTSLFKVGDGVNSWTGLAYGGLTGSSGSVWRTGTGVPSNSLGVNGDFYIDTATNRVYTKAAGAYTLTFTIISIPATIAQGGTNSTTSLNNNRVIKSSGGSIIEAAAITANRALASDSNGIPVATATTDTELGYVSGVTSALQTQINGKQATGNYITATTGDVLAAGPGSASATIDVGIVTDTKGALANKPACAVASTANQAALSGIPTIDGISTLIDGSLVLLTAQSTASQNGPWVVHSGAWTRPTWFPSGGTTQAFQFITVLIRLGTTYQGTIWRMTASGAITIDTTSQTWVVTPFAISATTITGVLPSANGGTATANTGSLVFSGSASVTGSNTGDQTITLTTDVTGSGTGSFAATIAANAVTNAKAAQMAANTIKGNNTGSTANAADLTIAQIVTLLAPTNRTATATGNINATDSGNIVYVNPSANITLTFPTKVAGQVFMLKDISGNLQTNNVTLARAGGSGKIENVSASYVWRTNFGELKIYDDGTNYWFM